MAAKAAPGPHPGGVCEASVLASKTALEAVGLAADGLCWVKGNTLTSFSFQAIPVTWPVFVLWAGSCFYTGKAWKTSWGDFNPCLETAVSGNKGCFATVFQQTL